MSDRLPAAIATTAERPNRGRPTAQPGVTEGTAMNLPPERDMRAAVAARDAAYDGRFYYGVVTTGVFCRPSCAARAARPENLRFFADHDSARAAGFRACKRCKPTLAASQRDILVRTARYIEAHADETLTLARLGSHAGLSASRLQRSFRKAFGVSPKAYQDACRLRQFKAALRGGDAVTGAIFSAGFGSTSRIYGESSRNIGMTPAAYRSGGAGETIAWACRPTALGPLMMAATVRGVCFVQFGDDADDLARQLQAEFPKAEIVRSAAADSPQLDAWLGALDRHISDGQPRPDLPLDLRGTAFQVRVWRFLLSVGEGEVVSYGEVAAAIERPQAVRAVASACAANRIGVLIPCHRVLRSDGTIGGYRWGAERKRTLLDNERLRRAGRK